MSKIASISVKVRVSLLALFAGLPAINGCTGSLPTVPQQSASISTSALPQQLLTIADIQYRGAFALPKNTYGGSSANWSDGIIEVNGNSMFIVGHAYDDAIAEFTIPPLSPATNASDLPVTSSPVQPFIKMLNKPSNGNKQQLDQIVGLELYNGKLFGHAVEYYDAPADNTQSTFVIDNSRDLNNSPVRGYYTINGKTRAAGWLSRVPDEYRSIVGCTHISGASSGAPIIARYSVGPSAFCINLDELITTKPNKTIRTAEMLGFSLNSPLHKDLSNDSGSNRLWTHLSQARYGFIVPGTRTYMTVGRSGGHVSRVGYKLPRKDASDCPGYCPENPEDSYNYYWLWDMNDLISVRRGRKSSSSVKPYESGVFPTPFQSAPGLQGIIGGSFDEATGLLYLTIKGTQLAQNGAINPPVVAAYSFKK